MPFPLLRTPEARAHAGRLLLRAGIAGIVGAHGWARLLAGAVPPFGVFLETQGFPLGIAWAAAVTGLEIVGSALLLVGRCVAPLALALGAVYATGIALIHAKAGWFVVGLGRNGAEFGVLLVVALLATALLHAGPGRRR